MVEYHWKLVPQLQDRIGALARKQGTTLSDLAESVLRSYADEAERAINEHAEDESRWQRYLEASASVPFNTARSKLRGLAADAARKAAPDEIRFPARGGRRH